MRHRNLRLGKLWSQDQRPIVQLLLNDLRAEPIGRSSQCGHVGDRQKRIIVLAEGDLASIELLLDEGVAIEIVGQPGMARRKPPASRSVQVPRRKCRNSSA
jgi:hypothetical protein